MMRSCKIYGLMCLTWQLPWITWKEKLFISNSATNLIGLQMNSPAFRSELLKYSSKKYILAIVSSEGSQRFGFSLVRFGQKWHHIIGQLCSALIWFTAGLLSTHYGLYQLSACLHRNNYTLGHFNLSQPYFSVLSQELQYARGLYFLYAVLQIGNTI